MKGKKLISVILTAVYMALLLTSFPGCGNEKNPGGTTGLTGEVQGTTEVTGSEENTGVSGGLETENSGEKLGRPVFSNISAEKYTEPEYKPIQYVKAVKPYKVAADLSNIENLEQFGDFAAEQKRMLSQNGFVVTPSGEEQLFYLYEQNQYLKLPGFVTADSVLQVYHIFFDYSLRTLESQKLLGALEQLTDNMLQKSIILHNSLKNSEVKAEALMNVAYFAVAQLALKKELPENMPAEAADFAQKEFALMTAERGFEKSPIFGYQLDYSQYKPRGHYTRSEDFQRYFRAMMWYGQAPFALYSRGEDGEAVKDIKKTTRALLITCSIFMDYKNTSDAALWEKIYNPTIFYVGSTDDLNIFHYKDLILKVYGAEPDLDGLMEEDKMAALYREAEKLPEPKIQAEWATVNTPVGKQFRFMGQRYIPDSEILQKLVNAPSRPMPSGLDVMGVLGSDRAYDLLVDKYKVSTQWPEYPSKFKSLKDSFSQTPDGTWRSNMYYGWLWTLKALLAPFGKGYPSFMTNEAWMDKSLNTALGSWSELRHDTILYGKQSGAECGGGDAPPVVRGYVEPNVELYEKLLWLTRYSRENLAQREILPEDMQNRMQAFEDLLDFLIACSVKELKNQELSKEEYDTLLTYGGTLEFLTSSMAENGMRWFEITSDTDKNMAVIADVHTNPGSYLEAGVGQAAQIFVVVPIGGKLYLTRGAVFSYYEFVSDKRLTDEEWQKMLKDKSQPSQPQWMESFIEGDKSEIPIPAEPYNSGC